MTIQEIRIGNYIRHNVLDDVSQFVEPNEDAIGEDDMLHFLGGIGLDKAEPIPLTEEWLKKLGFELDESAGNWKEPDYIIYRHGGLAIAKSPAGNFLLYRQCDDDFYSTYWPKIESVHHLQNCFYALTQTELTIKP